MRPPRSVLRTVVTSAIGGTLAMLYVAPVVAMILLLAVVCVRAVG